MTFLTPARPKGKFERRLAYVTMKNEPKPRPCYSGALASIPK
jgi:hypothetical protein